MLNSVGIKSARLAQQMQVGGVGGIHACGCVGPQNGQPLCPCRMRGVIERDGRYIMPEQDLGPVAHRPQLVPDGQSASGFRLLGMFFVGKHD